MEFCYNQCCAISKPAGTRDKGDAMRGLSTMNLEQKEVF